MRKRMNAPGPEMRTDELFPNILLALFLSSTLILGAGCSEEGAGGAPTCVPNEVRQCTCSEGRPGRQVCQSNHTFGTCRCLGPDAVAPDGWSGRQCPGDPPGDEATYVAPDGNPGAPGTRSEPTTPDAALSDLEAGDTVVFLKGEYTLDASPSVSGTEEEPIVLRSDSPGAATVDSDAQYAFDLQGVEHYRIRGFDFGPGSSRWIRLQGAKHVRLSDLRLAEYDRSDGPAPLLVDNSRHIHVLDSSVADSEHPRTVHVDDVSVHVVVAGNDFTRTAAWSLAVEQSEKILVRANVFHNGIGPNLRLWYANEFHIDRNVFTNGVDGPGVSGAHNLVRGTVGYFRYNRMFRNWGTLFRIEGMTPNDPDCPESQKPDECMATSHIQIYNNVIDEIADRGAGSGLAIRYAEESREVYNQRVKNNLVTRVGSDREDAVQVSYPDYARAYKLESNVFWPGANARPTLVQRGEQYGVDETPRDDGEDRGWKTSGNRAVEPEVLELDARDYRPRVGSPLVDAGVHLTKTQSPPPEGKLDDANTNCRPGVPVTYVVRPEYFYDRKPEGTGDLVETESSPGVARVEDVNFCRYNIKKEGGTTVTKQRWELELDRDLDWSPGEGFGLAWAGSAPDVGAWERGAENRPMIGIDRDPYVVEAGEPVQLRAVVGGDVDPERFRWKFGDGVERCGRAVTHRYREGGDYGIRLQVVAEDGTVYRATDHVLVKGDVVDPTRFEYHQGLVGKHLCEEDAEEAPDGGLRCARD